jgi:hypothetical protein
MVKRREIAAESFALDAKLEAVKGNSQEEQALQARSYSKNLH